ncbi:MAG: DpnII family type II restriction endonuclease [Cuniculiplasma sp.]|jgi:type II restriction enzyme
MVDFKLLGFDTFESYLYNFRNSLLKTFHGYKFFVDWKKVRENTKKHVVELGLLNSLTLEQNHSDRIELLRKILTEHPKTINVIPSLIAVRDRNIEVAEIVGQIINTHFNFEERNADSKDIDNMVSFCEKTGIIDLFDIIKDTFTYVVGVEVGLDSNARKNRSGEAFGTLIQELINSEVQNLVYSGQPFSWKREVELSNLGIGYPKQKKADFVIFYSEKPLVVCEVNVYHGVGSKPNEVVRSYTQMGGLLNSSGIKFLWFTDGPGWIQMGTQLIEGASNLEYMVNYNIALKNLGKLLLHLVS